jgi:hypothetical protein
LIKDLKYIVPIKSKISKNLHEQISKKVVAKHKLILTFCFRVLTPHPCHFIYWANDLENSVQYVTQPIFIDMETTP